MKLIKNKILGAASLLAGIAAASSCGPSLQNGDLAFVPAADGAMDGAISAATSDEKLNYSHVGIVEVSYDGMFIIEAEPEHGVVRTPLEDFRQSNGTVHFYRLKDGLSAGDAVERAKEKLGLKYDYLYSPTAEAFYCSELVWACYLSDGKPIFPSEPMNFKAADGSMPEFWTKLFKSMDATIPQGEPGTNPNGLIKSGLLVRLPDYK